MDISLYFEKQGEGFPLVLLHGNGENGGYFVNQVEYFKDDFSVYSVDTRGHGKSPRGTAPFTVKQFAEDLKCFFDSQKIDKAIILGFSDGANIAMEFALKYQNRVEKLILNGGNINTRGVKSRYQIPIELGYLVTKFFSKRSEDALKNHELLSLMAGQPDIKPEELKSISVPTLVIAGNNDMIKTSHTQLIAKSIPGSKLVFLDGDHFIAQKNSSDFNRTVSEFLCE